MLLKLINTCIFDEASVFCSSIYREDASQYFKIIFIFFLGNSFKLASNISYLLFSVSRLILISIEKKPTIIKGATSIKRLKYSLYFMSILFASCLLSAFKLFQYRINVERDFLRDFPYEIYDEFSCGSTNDFDVKWKCNLLNFFKILNSVINDILLVVLNLIVDIILLKNFHQHLDNKTRHIIDMDQHKNIKKSKKKINRMICLNSLLYVVSHLPEFLVTLLLVVFAKSVAKFCHFNFSCHLMGEEAEFFSLVSIVCQFFIFKVFDKNFKASCKDLKERFFSRLFCDQAKKVGGQTQQNNSAGKVVELKNLTNLIGNGLID